MSQIEGQGGRKFDAAIPRSGKGVVKLSPLVLEGLAGSILFGRAELAIVSNARDHQLPICPAAAVAGDRIEPVNDRLLEEGTGRLPGLLKPSG